MIKALLVAALATTAAISTAADAEIVVESNSDGYNADGFKQSEGKWAESAAKSRAPGLRASKAYYNDANTTGAGSARFTPNVPVAGHFEVFGTYPASGNAAGVPYKVHSADGDKTVTFDQNGRDPSSRPPADQWFSLGTFSFKQGTEGYVEISDPLTGKRAFANEPNARIYADAIKLVPTDVKLPADYANKINGAAPAGNAPASAAAPSSIAGIPSLPTGPAAPAGAGLPPLPGPKGSASMPTLPSSTGAAASSLPSLAAAASATPGLPSLASAGTSSLPSLPGGPVASSSLPSLPNASTSGAGASTLPVLPGGPSSGSTALPSLPSAAASSAPAGGLPTLPAAAGSQSAGLPTLPASGGTVPPPTVSTFPGLPTLGASSSPPDTNVPPPLPAMSGPAPSSAAALSAAPALPGAPSLPPPPGLNLPAPPPTGLPPTSASAPPPPAVPGSTDSNPSNLQWSYDFGAGLNQARATNKKALVFFVAPGNHQAITYETDYFQKPEVRSVLDQFVLVKINFAQNTRLGYALDIYGAGQIAITDAAGTKIGSIPQMPASADEFVKALQAIK